LNIADQGIDVARSGPAVKRRRYSTATLMPQNDDETCAKMLDRVLDATQGIIIHQIAGRADDEEVPDVLIENDFGRRPRIGASNDNGKRMLFLMDGVV
jgi:hypothetical protein